MQKPIVNELQDEYAGTVDIHYLDVYDVLEEDQMDKESLKAKLDEIKGN